MDNSNWGYWFYETRGSGVWLNLGVTLDYSCDRMLRSQSLLHNSTLYQDTCDRYGMITQYPNTWHANIRMHDRFATVPRDTSIIFHTFVQEDKLFWKHRRLGVDTVVRYWGMDLRNAGEHAKREVSDIRSHSATNGVCAGYTNSNSQLRKGWTASVTCICSGTVKWRAGSYLYHGRIVNLFLNCGLGSFPKAVERLEKPMD